MLLHLNVAIASLISPTIRACSLFAIWRSCNGETEECSWSGVNVDR
jgi:hypothetical protein